MNPDDATIDQVIAHEAHHAAMAHTLSVGVGSLSVVPYGPIRGRMRHARCNPVEEFLITLAPLIAEHRAPAWPVTAPTDDDQADLAHLIQTHNIAREHYDDLVDIARHLSASHLYRRAHAAYADALKRQGPEIDPEASIHLTRLLEVEE